MKIVVIGGTGLIGSKIVARLRQGRNEIVAASRRGGVNTITGAGLNEAMAGAHVVIDVSNAPSYDRQAALGFFETSGRNLLAAEAAARVQHHVALSIVWDDLVPDPGLLPRQGPREAGQVLQYSLHDHPLDPIPGIPR